MTEPGGLFAGGADLLDTGRTLYELQVAGFAGRARVRPAPFRKRIERS
jgi:hypothetical protein